MALRNSAARMAYYQIQSLDDLKQVYADVQVVHVASDDVGVSNPNRPQQIVLDESQQILLQNDGQQQVVYQTPQQQSQYQPPAAGAHYTILGEDINQQQQQQQQQHQQQQQVLMQQQQHQVMEQHQQQPHQIQSYQIQQETQHMQVTDHQMQHIQPQSQQPQQIYYTTEQLVQPNAIVQHSPHAQQTQAQQQKKVYIQQQPQTLQQQFQQTPAQQHQLIHQPQAPQQQQHILQSPQHTQQVQVQHQVSPPAQHQQPPQQQQIIYRMQTQQPTAQLQQQTQLLSNTHVIVQQPSGQQVLIQQPQQQEIIMRQPMGQQRILYNNRVLYSTQQPPQQQQQTILHQSPQHQQQQQHIQLQTSSMHHTQAHLVQARVAQQQQQQTQPQQTTAPSQQQPQQLQQNVVYHQIQVQGNPLQKSLQGQSPVSTQIVQQQQQGQQQHIQIQQQQQQQPQQTQIMNASPNQNPSTTLIRAASTRGGKTGRGAMGSTMIARMPGVPGVPRAEIRPTFAAATGGGPVTTAQVLRTPRPRCSTSANTPPRTRGVRGPRGGATIVAGRSAQISVGATQVVNNSNPLSSGVAQQGNIIPQGMSGRGIRQIYRTQLGDNNNVSTQHQQLHLVQSQPQTRIASTTSRFRSPPITSDQSLQQSPQTPSASTSAATGSGGNFELDLEDSIQAVFVKKDGQKSINPVLANSQMGGTTLTTYYGAKDDDDNRMVKMQNGTCMTLAEYKKRNAGTQNIQNPGMKALHQAPGGAKISLPTAGQSMHAVPVARVAPQKHQTSCEQQQQTQQATQPTAAVVAPASSVHQTSHNNYEIQTQHVLQNRSGQQMAEKDRNSAKMLVILVSGEQRLITFTLPRESCTVQDLLEQVGVPFDSNTTIQCVENPGANIDFVVTVGFSVQESASELISRAEQSLQMSRQQESMAQHGGATTTANAPNVNNAVSGNSSQQSSSSGLSSTSSTPTGITQQDDLSKDSTSKSTAIASKGEELPQRKLIQGYYAICQSCGFSGYDHAKCERCRRVFVEPPKKVPVKQAATGSTASNSPGNAENISSTSASQVDKKRSAELVVQRGKTSLQYNANISSSRGRGAVQAVRGRGTRSGRRPAEVEPVILTLSSDEDDDEVSNKGNSILSGNVVSSTSTSAVASFAAYKPLPFESNIPEKDESLIYTDFKRGDVTDLSDCSDQLSTTLSCRVIRLGTYSFEPREPVIITSKGIHIVAPLEANTSEVCTLNIYTREVIKIVAHFSRTTESTLCFYTLRKCAQYIRNALKMSDGAAPMDGETYFSASGPSQTRKIILQIDSIGDQAQSVIRSIWDILEEVSLADAQVLIQRATESDRKFADSKQNCESNPTTTQLQPNDIRQLLIYPPGKGGISINTEDYLCLATDQYLNDIIIDFYLKWLHDNVIPKTEKDRTFIFSTFFYERLTTFTRHTNPDKDVKQTAAQKRHARVQNWTKNVNLFEKDFIIIPINEQSHWFLAIICFPGLKGPVTFDTHIPVELQPIKKTKGKKVSLQIGNTTITPLSKRESASVLADVCGVGDDDSERDEAEGDDSDLASEDSDYDNCSSNAPNNSQSNASGSSTGANNTASQQPIKQPLILIFDSLAGASRSRVVATLRDYLSCEYKVKLPEIPAHTFNKDNMPGHCVKVPQQNNFTDCGLYLLQYVEQFFNDPIRDYRIPIKQLANWFDTITVTRKREDISNLLQKLMNERNGPHNRILLPDIPFPTLNGQLVEPEGYNIEFEEDEIDEDDEDERSTVELETELSTDDTSKSKTPIKMPQASNSTTLVPTQGRKIVVKRRMQLGTVNTDMTTSSHTTGTTTPPIATAQRPTSLAKIRKVDP
uniref:Ubiquitin-like protease family profile domain-containing protein n=1 Tax=Glossina pallidipes TaxID=7398 RepID=A0A1A9Z8V3_GLOPL